MKKTISSLNIKAYTFLYGIFFLLPVVTFSQRDTSTKAPTTEDTTVVTKEEDVEEESTVSPSIDFSCLQKTSAITLTAKLKGKLNGSLRVFPSLKIDFFVTTETGDSKIGEAVTNFDGVATIDCKDEALIKSADGKIHFKASYAGNKGIDPVEEVVAVRRAKILVTPVKEDSSYSLQIKLVDASAVVEKPLPQIAVSVFVKRLFSNLKVGEGTTDDNGDAVVQIPNNLPGNATGALTLLARVDDNEEYGNVETSIVENWGIPVSDKILKQQRSLFSHNPPMWMLITFIILMTTVWGHYVVIVYQLFKLKKQE